MSPVRTRLWDGTTLLGGDGEVPGWSNTIILGTTEPIGGTNIGAGIYEARDFPTATIVTGTGISYNSTNKRYTISTTVEDVVIPGFVTLTATGVIRNCWVKAPATEYASYTAMVEGPSTTGQGLVEWCTIAPELASPYYAGIGRGILARYTDVYDICDGVRGFSTSVNGFRGRFEACEFHHAAQFAPDYANPGGRPETHNDVGIQAQGNPNGDDTDIYFDGCRINARHSLTAGNLPPYRAQIAAIMITPAASQGAVHMTYTRGWLYGGDYCINAGSNGVNDFGPSSITITDNRFERPGTDIFGDGRAPTAAIALDSSLARVVSGNTYVDNGAPVPVTNA